MTDPTEPIHLVADPVRLHGTRPVHGGSIIERIVAAHLKPLLALDGAIALVGLLYGGVAWSLGASWSMGLLIGAATIGILHLTALAAALALAIWGPNTLGLQINVRQVDPDDRLPEEVWEALGLERPPAVTHLTFRERIKIGFGI